MTAFTESTGAGDAKRSTFTSHQPTARCRSVVPFRTFRKRSRHDGPTDRPQVCALSQPQRIAELALASVCKTSHIQTGERFNQVRSAARSGGLER